MRHLLAVLLVLAPAAAWASSGPSAHQVLPPKLPAPGPIGDEPVAQPAQAPTPPPVPFMLPKDKPATSARNPIPVGKNTTH